MAARARRADHRRARRLGRGSRLGFPRRGVSAGAQRALGGAGGIGGVHHRVGRRIPPRRAASSPAIRRSGTGGYVLLAQSEVPIVHDPDTAAGRDALVVQSPELARASFTRFRLRPGDDVSCLNLYRPGEPDDRRARRLVPRRAPLYVRDVARRDRAGARRIRGCCCAARSTTAPIPVIADATSLQYVLHASVGDTMAIDVGAAAPVTLRFVGALRDSVLQGELIIGEEQFVRLFPGSGGYPLLPDRLRPGVRPTAQAAALAGVVEKELQPFGVDAVSTIERLAAFHRVENTYLSTFQALGGLGLLLGTIGLAAVMFRNVLERRRELALLRAVGYDRAARPADDPRGDHLSAARRAGGGRGLCADRRHPGVALSRRGRTGARPDSSRRRDCVRRCDLGGSRDAGCGQRTAAGRASGRVGSQPRGSGARHFVIPVARIRTNPSPESEPRAPSHRQLT